MTCASQVSEGHGDDLRKSKGNLDLRTSSPLPYRAPHRPRNSKKNRALRAPTLSRSKFASALRAHPLNYVLFIALHAHPLNIFFFSCAPRAPTELKFSLACSARTPLNLNVFVCSARAPLNSNVLPRAPRAPTICIPPSLSETLSF